MIMQPPSGVLRPFGKLLFRLFKILQKELCVFMCLFCSRNESFRCPTGALPAKSNLHLRICLPRSLGCSASVFLLHCDNGHSQNYSMFWCGMEGDDYEWWECDCAPKQTGIYWYSFLLTTWCGTRKIGRGRNGYGILDSELPFQLTVYDPALKTPDWLAGGIIYQIFPDRFFFSGEQSREIPAGRTLRSDWGNQPEWRPNHEGKITNTDFFCGDLRGITQKLDYLQSLGITCLYLNPIFEAHSNHRYDTADYESIDPLLGTEQDFARLCREAKAHGMRVLLDGVFNHTGSDSRYFNREGRYGSGGAYHDRTSPFYEWYRFIRWPELYDSWWGFETLPAIRHDSASFHQYIAGENGIAQKWMALGASGWRLDVVDELPDTLIDALHNRIRQQDPEGFLLGEVWEDASNKESYGHRRRYLLGGQLDSVMNYPFRSAIFNFLCGGDSAALIETVCTILENYPPQVVRLLMNHIGTHDTERALTVLAGEPSRGRGREWQSGQQLSPEQYARGIARMKLAAAIQFLLPGVPSIYYGDEAGMQGYADPFNRGCYPWGNENQELLAWYRFLGRLRKENSCLAQGRFLPLESHGGLLSFIRKDARCALLLACNRSQTEELLPLPAEWHSARSLCGAAPQNGALLLAPESITILGCSEK